MRNKEQLLNRIRQLTTVTIEQMSNDVLDRLTMGYDESLVRALLLQGQNNLTQRRIFGRVKIAFDHYYYSPFTKCPDYMLDYMKDIQLDLECGVVLTDTVVKSENDTESVAKGKEKPTISQKDAHNTEKLKRENEELKAKVEDLEEQIAEVKNKVRGMSLGINQAQAALFGLSLANTFGFNYSNKKKDLSPMLHKLFGWGEAKIATYMSTPCEKEKREELANLFKVLSPQLYTTIMHRGELPPEVTPHYEKVTPSEG